tara:strand:+ start:357 stop:731 length:375 start_codon:yes stop_codon:yes gene_type:complete
MNLLIVIVVLIIIVVIICSLTKKVNNKYPSLNLDQSSDRFEERGKAIGRNIVCLPTTLDHPDFSEGTHSLAYVSKEDVDECLRPQNGCGGQYFYDQNSKKLVLDKTPDDNEACLNRLKSGSTPF